MRHSVALTLLVLLTVAACGVRTQAAPAAVSERVRADRISRDIANDVTVSLGGSARSGHVWGYGSASSCKGHEDQSFYLVDMSISYPQRSATRVKSTVRQVLRAKGMSISDKDGDVVSGTAGRVTVDVVPESQEGLWTDSSISVTLPCVKINGSSPALRRVSHNHAIINISSVDVSP